MTYLYPHERELTCTRCGELVGIFEAAFGARSVEEHRHVGSDREFVCDPCGVLKADLGGRTAASESVKT